MPPFEKPVERSSLAAVASCLLSLALSRFMAERSPSLPSPASMWTRHCQACPSGNPPCLWVFGKFANPSLPLVGGWIPSIWHPWQCDLHQYCYELHGDGCGAEPCVGGLPAEAGVVAAFHSNACGLTLPCCLCPATHPARDWCKSVEPSLHVHGVHFQSLDLFGPRVGFLKFKVSVLDERDRRRLQRALSSRVPAWPVPPCRTMVVLQLKGGVGCSVV